MALCLLSAFVSSLFFTIVNPRLDTLRVTKQRTARLIQKKHNGMQLLHKQQNSARQLQHWQQYYNRQLANFKRPIHTALLITQLTQLIKKQQLLIQSFVMKPPNYENHITMQRTELKVSGPFIAIMQLLNELAKLPYLNWFTELSLQSTDKLGMIKLAGQLWFAYGTNCGEVCQ